MHFSKWCLPEIYSKQIFAARLLFGLNINILQINITNEIQLVLSTYTVVTITFSIVALYMLNTYTVYKKLALFLQMLARSRRKVRTLENILGILTFTFHFTRSVYSSAAWKWAASAAVFTSKITSKC